MQGGIVINKNDLMNTIQSLEEKGIEGIGAYELSRILKSSRKEIGECLIELYDDGLLQKKADNPSKYVLVKKKTKDCFEDIIGYQSSLAQVIEQFKVAVDYPGGLPILICGKSGTGKSMLARKIYEYAKQSHAIQEDAPFITLNCADYADNPQLLTSVLFGYKKGAFTGANENHIGMVEEGDGGFIFLDEVHRLSYESQEKLFMLMDQGRFRPLGESSNWKSAHVRFVLATTENIDEVFLGTFRRRIPVKATIPSVSERPLRDRIELICQFFQNESNLLNVKIEVSTHVLSYLVLCDFEGNVGELENVVKLAVARGYFKNSDKSFIVVDEECIKELDVKECKTQLIKSNLVVEPLKDFSHYVHPYALPKQLSDFLLSLEQFSMNPPTFDSLYENTMALMDEAESYMKKSSRFDHLISNRFYQICDEIFEQYGMIPNHKIDGLCFYLHEMTPVIQISNYSKMNSLKEYVKKYYPSSLYIANQLMDKLRKDRLIREEHMKIMSCLVALILHKAIHINEAIHGIIVAHGDSTAHSIAKVANVLCQSFVFEAFDMNLHSSLDDIVRSVSNYLSNFKQISGIVLMFDMGSLGELYSKIRDNVGCDLLVINSLTTSMALQMGMQIKNKDRMFGDVVETIKPNLIVESQYYEGSTAVNNIIITSLSGLDISNKVKDIFHKHLQSESLQIHCIDFDLIQKSLKNSEDFMFRGTRAILTTSDTLQSDQITIINLAKMIQGEESALFYNEVSDILSEEQYYAIKSDILKFFSMEGASERLRFLNPQVVIDEIEDALKIYEKELKIDLEDFRRANLYVHISAMIERLMLKENMHTDDIGLVSEEDQHFYEVSCIALHNILTKYKIQLTLEESYLIYLLFQ